MAPVSSGGPPGGPQPPPLLPVGNPSQATRNNNSPAAPNAYKAHKAPASSPTNATKPPAKPASSPYEALDKLLRLVEPGFRASAKELAQELRKALEKPRKAILEVVTTAVKEAIKAEGLTRAPTSKTPSAPKHAPEKPTNPKLYSQVLVQLGALPTSLVNRTLEQVV